jgi:hypothetical protein
MNYDLQILHILSEVGERGISVSSLTKHVYNQNRTFFSSPDYEEIRQYVGQYLLRNSKSPESLIESTGRRGYYRLNTQGSANARQLMLDFREEQESTENEQLSDSNVCSLSLFPDFEE